MLLHLPSAKPKSRNKIFQHIHMLHPHQGLCENFPESFFPLLLKNKAKTHSNSTFALRKSASIISPLKAVAMAAAFLFFMWLIYQYLISFS